MHAHTGDYSRKMVCFYCSALQWVYTGPDPDGLPNDPALLYTSFGEQARHRRTFLNLYQLMSLI